jgi:ADP-heptose:LPS heptosyltransferase
MLFDAKHPVAFYANGIGDAILNLPALRALADLFQGQLTLVTDDIAEKICCPELCLKKQIILSLLPVDGAPAFDVSNIVRQIPNCDLFISLVPWHSKSLTELISSLKPNRSVGFFEHYDTVLRLDYTKHSAELSFDVPKLLRPNLLFENYTSPPAFLQSATPFARQLRALAGSGMRILAVHDETVPEKVWPLSHLITTLDLFLDTRKDFLAFVVGVKHQPVDCIRNGDRVIPCFGLTLAESCSIVTNADLFLGVDSCMLHFADFARVPGVGLFGSTNCNEFGFRISRHRHISGNGMDAIQPTDVCEAINSLIKELDDT